MEIENIQDKLALSEGLVDTFGRVHDYLRISITDRCDLRCTYCMPADRTTFTPSSRLMSAEEIHSLAEVFVDFGIKKIRLTGGEPLMRSDVRQIIDLLSKLPVELTITTNATRVNEFIDDFRNAGIDSVNVSLDTFDKKTFFKITRRDNFDEVLANIHQLVKHDFNVKINAVVINGINEKEVTDFIEFTRNNPIHIRFIEFMPFPGNEWSVEKVFTYKQMLDVVERKYAIEKLNDEKHSTAKKYKVPGFSGTFAFINTITLPFCGDCNRLRLTADGKLKNCLFSKGEVDVLTPFRNGVDIHSIIVSSVKSKKKELGGQLLFATTENRSMIAIGG